jgi:two-component system, NtrC family, response regulator AtoC
VCLVCCVQYKRRIMAPDITLDAKQLAESRSGVPPDAVLFGRSEAMATLKHRAQKVCATSVQVLLCGDGGTGKEVLARWIHANSTVASGEFVSVNCAAIPRALMESELFGYEKGAFTGARSAKEGRVELAHNGTLFLDEIAELESSLQGKLLHFLQDGCFSRIGDVSERRVNARVICATGKNLEEQVAAKRFRADLFHRVNVVQLRLPRLNERLDDLPILAEYFRLHYEKQFGRTAEPLTSDVISYLQSLNWHGNVRELSNEIARYVLIGPDAMIGRELLNRNTRLRPVSQDARRVPLKRIAADAVREMERKLILEALKANRWNRRKAAEALKISYRALIYKIRDAGLTHRPARPATNSDEPRGTNRPSKDTLSS